MFQGLGLASALVDSLSSDPDPLSLLSPIACCLHCIKLALAVHLCRPFHLSGRKHKSSCRKIRYATTSTHKSLILEAANLLELYNLWMCLAQWVSLIYRNMLVSKENQQEYANSVCRCNMPIRPHKKRKHFSIVEWAWFFLHQLPSNCIGRVFVIINARCRSVLVVPAKTIPPAHSGLRNVMLN